MHDARRTTVMAIHGTRLGGGVSFCTHYPAGGACLDGFGRRSALLFGGRVRGYDLMRYS